MYSISLRSARNSPLSFTELDNNFKELDFRTKYGWFDLQSALYTRPGGNSPGYAQFQDRIYRPELQKGLEQELYADFHINHDYSPGTMIYPHLHFTTNSNNSGSVKINFQYTWARRHESDGQTTFTSSITKSSIINIQANHAKTHFVTELAEGDGIDGTGLEADVVIMMCVWRDAVDTFPDSILAIQADCHYEKDRSATPNRAPNFYG